MRTFNKRMMVIAGALSALLSSAAAQADEYDLEILVPPSAFHGVHGMDFDADGALYAGDILGMSVHKIDIATGETEVVVGPPYGASDDVKVAPDGSLVWTSIPTGIIYLRTPDGVIHEIATGMPAINTVGFHPDGRLFAVQHGGADALFEIDLDGVRPPRVVMQPSGGLNGFVILDDGYLYGPQGSLGTVVRVNLETGEHRVLAHGFHDPTGVKSDSSGTLYVNELATGTLSRLDKNTGEVSVLAQLSPGNDNITVSDNDLIYVSNFTHNSIEEVDPKTGAVRDVIRGYMSVPGGLALHTDGDTEWLYVADLYTTRRVNTATGEAEIVEKAMGMSTSAYGSSATIRGNRLLLSSWFRNAVQVIDLNTLDPVTAIRGLKAPHDALELDDGTVLIAETGAHRLVQMSLAGDVIKVVADGLDSPIGLALRDSSTVYVTDAAAGTVLEINLITGIQQTVATGLMQPEGLAMDHDGHILVVDARARSLVRIDPETGHKAVLITDLPLGLQGPPPMLPTWVHNDVVVGADGTILINADTEGALYKVVPR